MKSVLLLAGAAGVCFALARPHAPSRREPVDEAPPLTAPQHGAVALTTELTGTAISDSGDLTVRMNVRNLESKPAPRSTTTLELIDHNGRPVRAMQRHELGEAAAARATEIATVTVGRPTADGYYALRARTTFHGPASQQGAEAYLYLHATRDGLLPVDMNEWWAASGAMTAVKLSDTSGPGRKGAN